MWRLRLCLKFLSSLGLIDEKTSCWERRMALLRSALLLFTFSIFNFNSILFLRSFFSPFFRVYWVHFFFLVCAVRCFSFTSLMTLRSSPAKRKNKELTTTEPDEILTFLSRLSWENLLHFSVFWLTGKMLSSWRCSLVGELQVFCSRYHTKSSCFRGVLTIDTFFNTNFSLMFDIYVKKSWTNRSNDKLKQSIHYRAEASERERTLIFCLFFNFVSFFFFYFFGHTTDMEVQ